MCPQRDDLKIREAAPQDIPLIVEVAEQVWKQTYSPIISEEQINYMYDRMYSASALEDQMNKGKHQFFIAETYYKPLGFVSAVLADDEVCKIPKLYVRSDIQGKGIGRALLEKVQYWAKENNRTKLQLNVNRNNPAINFYTRIGFIIIETVDIPLANFFLNDFVMEKTI